MTSRGSTTYTLTIWHTVPIKKKTGYRNEYVNTSSREEALSDQQTYQIPAQSIHYTSTMFAGKILIALWTVCIVVLSLWHSPVCSLLVHRPSRLQQQRCGTTTSTTTCSNRLHWTLHIPHNRQVSSSTQLHGIAEKFTGLVEGLMGRTRISEENIAETLREVKTILVDADVNLQIANTIIDKVKERALGMKVDSSQKPGEQFISLLAAELVDVMGSSKSGLQKRTDSRPNVILLLGLQGVGKTTASAKLANLVMKEGYGKKVLLVAADVYRPAAVEQLKILGQRLNIDVYEEGTDADPVQISRRAFDKAKREGYDTVIVDTAGRQVVDTKLMDELKQIKTALLPDESLLVVDAMTGQQAATLTARFENDVGITGAILTKMDGDSRGGAALSIRGVSGKPIKFIGVGENLDDLEPFYPERMASRILGFGDIKTLLEKAEVSGRVVLYVFPLVWYVLTLMI